MPTSGAAASQNPNAKATCPAWRRLSRRGPSAIAVRKLSRLRVNPRMSRSPIRQLLLRQREDEESVSMGRPEHPGQEALHPRSPPDRYGDVLPSVDAVGRRAAVVTASRLEVPQQFPGAGVERVELSRGFAGEHEVAAG